MKPEDELRAKPASLDFVRTVIARETVRAIANVRPKPAKNITENIPAESRTNPGPNWSVQDSIRCWDEYIAMCREAHLQGDPVPSFFLSERGPA